MPQAVETPSSILKWANGSFKPQILTPSDVTKAAVTLCEAFQNDKLSRYLTQHFSSEKEKRKFNITMYECFLRQHIDKGICVGIGELSHAFETVAIWSAPDSYERGLESFPDFMESGFDELWHMAGSEGVNKLFKGLLPLLDETSERIMSTETFKGKGVYTLVYLGSIAEARGKGNVRAMFDYMFKNYIDLPNTNNIAYLESSAASNIAIYNKFGFYAREKLVLGDKNREGAVESEDYAVMNVMIRGTFGKDWTKI